MHIQCFFPLKLTETYTRDVQILYILAGVQLYMSPFRGRACTTSSLVDLDVLKTKKREREKQEASVNITVRRGKNPVHNLELTLKLFTKMMFTLPKIFCSLKLL